MEDIEEDASERRKPKAGRKEKREEWEKTGWETIMITREEDRNEGLGRVQVIDEQELELMDEWNRERAEENIKKRKHEESEKEREIERSNMKRKKEKSDPAEEVKLSWIRNLEENRRSNLNLTPERKMIAESPVQARKVSKDEEEEGRKRKRKETSKRKNSKKESGKPSYGGIHRGNLTSDLSKWMTKVNANETAIRGVSSDKTRIEREGAENEEKERETGESRESNDGEILRRNLAPDMELSLIHI